jgi:hypothetical protein
VERPVRQVLAPVPWSLVGWGCPASLHWACTRASWMWRTYSGGWRVCASISSTSSGKLATAGHWHTRWVVIARLPTYAMWHMYHPTSTQMVYKYGYCRGTTRQHGGVSPKTRLWASRMSGSTVTPPWVIWVKCRSGAFPTFDLLLVQGENGDGQPWTRCRVAQGADRNGEHLRVPRAAMCCACPL